MKEKRKASAILAILSLIISTFVVILPPVYASSSGVDVSFPSYYWSFPDHKPGDTVVMELWIDNSSSTQEAVISFQADFSWDPTVLNCTGIYEGLFLRGPYLNWSTTFTAGTINNVAGTVTGLNGTLTQAGKNATAGSGTLAYVWFKVLRFGSSVITLANVDVLDPSWTSVAPINTANGYFELSVQVSLASYSWSYPDQKPTDVVVMELYIDAPEAADWTDGVFSWQASFSFDPKILEAVTVYKGAYLAGPYLNWTNTLTIGGINNVAGTITNVNGTLTQAGKKATGSGILAYLAFKVIGTGSTTVTITSCTVLDDSYRSIPLTLTDGSFEMGLEVSLPTVNWWYPDHDIGDVVVMELYIDAPEAADWTDGVFSWQADFSWDPTVLQALSPLKGTYLAGPYLNWTNTFTAGTINNTAGTLTSVNGTLTQANVNVTGSGILAFLRFEVVGTGSTDITITDCTVLVSDPHAVPLTLVDGHFGLGETISLPTYEWAYPDHEPGDAVVMELQIDTPELYAWQAGFSWNPDVLDLVSVMEGPYLSDVNTTTFTAGTINNTAGTATPYGCTLQGNFSASGPGILAYLVFSVTGIGSTAVELTDVILEDPDLHDVPPTIVDGQFDFGAEVEIGSDIIWRYPDKDIGDTFTADLTIKTASLFAWQAGFTFNPDVLEVLSITEGPYLSDAGSTTFINSSSLINNTAGTVDAFSCTLLGNFSAGPTGEDGAVIASVEFNVTGAGLSAIDLTDVDLDPSEVVLYTLDNATLSLVEVPPVLTDGYFELGAMVELPVESVTYPAEDIGYTFDMNLTIKTPSLFAWQAGFSWDPDVLNCTGITEGDYLSNVGSTNFILGTINNTAGTATPFGCTLLGGSPAGPTGSGGAVIATLSFEVVGVGNTTVSITDVGLYGSEIPYTIVDGYFALGIQITFEPSNVGPIVVGSYFDVNLTIITPSLYCWQAGLSFNPNVLEVIDVTEGPYLNDTGNTTWIFDSSFIDNNAGTVKPFGCTLLGDVTAGPTGAGGKVIATITFRVVGYAPAPYGTTKIGVTDFEAYSSVIPLDIVVSLKFKLKVGDVNADGVINVLDIILVLIHVGPNPGYPYAPDLNHDGTVNVLDIILALINVGPY